MKNKNMKITFSIHEYDSDGDIIEKGIFIHINEVKIKIADNLKEFEKLPKHFKRMAKEIKENYA